MSKYKITNTAYQQYRVFKYNEDTKHWDIQAGISKYSVRFVDVFISLEDAKYVVAYKKREDELLEEVRKDKEAWKPMEDLIL